MADRFRFLTRTLSLCCVMFVVYTFVIHTSLYGGAGEVPHPQYHIQGKAFGTTYSVKVRFTEGFQSPDLQGLNNRIDQTIEEIDQQMSLWRDDSELSRFNTYTSDEWFPVSEDTARVVDTAITISRQSTGAFDPTVKPLMQLWSFGPEQQPLRVPSEDQIAERQQHIGIDKLEVRRSPPALRKLDSKMQLDLNAIAKGDAVDRVATSLDDLAESWGELAVVGYMVEIGGEVRTSGTNESGQPWSIGIERPVAGVREVQSILDANELSLATSGDYRNYIETDGKRYSHTIDPRSGRPIEHALASVSVVADDCMTADAWATALMVLGSEEGQRMAEEMGLAAMFVVHDGDGFTTFQTATFPPVRTLSSTTPRGNALSTFLIAAGVFGLAIMGMAVGVILSNRRLQGSCGGLNGLKDEKGNPLCEACTRPAEDCEQFREQVTASQPSESP